MAEQVLTSTEVLEIVYNSDESSSDSSSSDNEIDDTAVADAIISDDSGDEGEILHRDFRWETMDNYTGHREVFSCDFEPRNGAENVSDNVQCFELFFDKEIIQQIVRETNRYAEYKNARGNLFSFRSLVRSWTPVTESEIYTVLGLFLLMGIVQKPTAKSYFLKGRVISTPGFVDVISRERLELICKFLHFIDNESLQFSIQLLFIDK